MILMEYSFNYYLNLNQINLIKMNSLIYTIIMIKHHHQMLILYIILNLTFIFFFQD